MKTAIVIPAYNVAKTIGMIVTKCLLLNSPTTMVIDNNSIDRTLHNAHIRGGTVFKESQQGQGAATRNGWQRVIDDGYDVMVTMDADGQHNPEEIPILLKPIKEDTADIVVGSRFLNEYRIPRYRKLGINIINYLYNVLHKSKLTDSQSCFRVYNRLALKHLEIEENGFGFSTELLIKARKKGLRIIEMPVSCIYYADRHRNSTLHPFKHGIIVAYKTLLWRLKLWN